MINNNDILRFLETANNIEDESERVKFVRENIRPPTMKVLACFFNPDIQFFSPGKIDYKKNATYGKADSKLSIEVRRLRIFLNETAIDKKKKIQKLVLMCESIPAEEAEFLLNNILKKNNPFKNMGKVFIRNNFPEILNLNID